MILTFPSVRKPFNNASRRSCAIELGPLSRKTRFDQLQSDIPDPRSSASPSFDKVV